MRLIHCSYHKCLTVYFNRVFSGLYGTGGENGYRHFNSNLDDFYRESGSLAVASINNHALELTRLGGDFRLTRFIRDPRDLVVSGYHYHKRGAEDWCNIIDPGPDDLAVVNGVLPPGMPAGLSFAGYLQSLGEEDGLIAEIQFRRLHFESMMHWPDADSRIRLFRYEDIIGRETDVFSEIFFFYGLPWLQRVRGRRYATKYSAKRVGQSTDHIRNVAPRQWQSAFTERVNSYFNDHHAGILQRYGYDR